MTGRHRKPRTEMTARQKQVLRASAVAAPLTAGIMLTAATSASADSANIPQNQVFNTLQNAGGFTTQDHSFTYDPRTTAPNVTSPGADLKTDCTNAANSGTPCTVSDATIDADGSFRPVHVSSGYLGGNKVTLSDVRTHALTHPTVEESRKTANQYGIKASEKGKLEAQIPFIAKGEAEVGSEQSFQRTNEDTTTHKGPVEVDTNQRGSTRQL